MKSGVPHRVNFVYVLFSFIALAFDPMSIEEREKAIRKIGTRSVSVPFCGVVF